MKHYFVNALLHFNDVKTINLSIHIDAKYMKQFQCSFLQVDTAIPAVLSRSFFVFITVNLLLTATNQEKKSHCRHAMALLYLSFHKNGKLSMSIFP